MPRFYDILTLAFVWLAGMSVHADDFHFRVHDLQGKPLVPAPGKVHRMQIFEQQEGVQIDKIGERRTVQLNETDRGFGVITSTTNLIRATVPAGAATQSLVFVFQRSDESRPTATLAFLVMPQAMPNVPPRTHLLDIAIPTNVRAAPTQGYPLPCQRHKMFRLFRR